MSVSVIRSAKLEGTTATTSTVTITAPAVGNSLFVQVAMPTANIAGITFSDNLNGAWPAADFFQTGLYGSLNYYYFRKSNLANAPTSLMVSGTGSFTATFEYVEVSGADNTNPFVSSFGKTALSGGTSQTTHVATATTANPNDFVMMGINTSNGRSINSADGGYVVAGTETATLVHLMYLADAGSVGAKATTLTLSANASAYGLGVIYKAAKPAVTSVSSPTVNENGVLTYRVTLASAPTSITGYSGALAGYGSNPASPTADLTTTLLTAACTNGVTYSAGSFIVPTGGVTYWDVPLSVYDDALDEYDEQISLTVDGVVGVGTITDNDAPPVVTFSDGVESFGVVTCVATLGAVSGKDVTFDVSTANGSKTAGTHYTAIVAQTVTIPAGSLTAAITVNTL